MKRPADAGLFISASDGRPSDGIPAYSLLSRSHRVSLGCPNRGGLRVIVTRRRNGARRTKETDMEYLLMIYSDEKYWPKMSKAEQEQGVAAYMAYGEALKKAGVYKGSNRLAPTTSATTVHVANGKPKVLDGPYAESKEQLAGYYLIDVADLDSAISWASRCPGASHGTLEVRPLWTM
jgi:hypothetical protein